MLDSTVDLISQAVSNNPYVFCVFNLVIVVILMGLKHDSNQEIPLSTPTCDKQDIDVKQTVHRSEQARNSSRVWSTHETAAEDNKGNRNDFNANNIDDYDKDEEQDDELRRGVTEEFIAQLNREWRAEKLGMAISA